MNYNEIQWNDALDGDASLMDCDYLMVVIETDNIRLLERVPGMDTIVRVVNYFSGRQGTAGGPARTNFPNDIAIGRLGTAWKVSMHRDDDLKDAFVIAARKVDTAKRQHPVYSFSATAIGYHDDSAGNLTVGELADVCTEAGVPWIRLHMYGIKTSFGDTFNAMMDRLLDLAWTDQAANYWRKYVDEDLLPQEPFFAMDIGAHLDTGMGCVPLVRVHPREGAAMASGFRTFPTFLQMQKHKVLQPESGSYINHLFGTLRWKRIGLDVLEAMHHNEDDVMSRLLPAAAKSLVVYPTIVHVFKHAFRGNFSKMPTTNLAVKRVTSKLDDMANDWYRGHRQFEDVAVEQHKQHAGKIVARNNWLHQNRHLNGLRFEARIEDCSRIEAVALLGRMMLYVRTFLHQGEIEVQMVQLQYILATYWSCRVFLASSSILHADNSLKLHKSFLKNSKKGAVALLRNCLGFYTEPSRTFTSTRSQANIYFFDGGALLKNSRDNIRFPVDFGEIAGCASVCCADLGVHNLIAMQKVIMKVAQAHLHGQRVLSSRHLAHFKDISESFRKLLEVCRGIMTQEQLDMVEGGEADLPLEQANLVSEQVQLLGGWSLQQLREDRAQRLRRTMESVASHASGLPHAFGPLSIPETAAWAGTHIRIVTDGEARQWWLGPNARELPEEVPEELMRNVRRQLSNRSASSVLREVPEIVVGRLFMDIEQSLQTRLVQGFYKDRRVYGENTKDWIATVCDLDMAEQVWDPQNLPVGVHLARSHYWLAWQIAHQYGFGWRSRMVMFGPDPEHYFGRLACVSNNDPSQAFIKYVFAGDVPAREAAIAHLHQILPNMV